MRVFLYLQGLYHFGAVEENYPEATNRKELGTPVDVITNITARQVFYHMLLFSLLLSLLTRPKTHNTKTKKHNPWYWHGLFFTAGKELSVRNYQPTTGNLKFPSVWILSNICKILFYTVFPQKKDIKTENVRLDLTLKTPEKETILRLGCRKCAGVPYIENTCKSSCLKD